MKGDVIKVERKGYLPLKGDAQRKPARGPSTTFPATSVSIRYHTKISPKMRSTELPARGETKTLPPRRRVEGQSFAIRSIRVSDALFPWCREVSNDYCQYSPDLDLVFASDSSRSLWKVLAKTLQVLLQDLETVPCRAESNFALAMLF
jgi:hypothetical protein